MPIGLTPKDPMGRLLFILLRRMDRGTVFQWIAGLSAMGAAIKALSPIIKKLGNEEIVDFFIWVLVAIVLSGVFSFIAYLKSQKEKDEKSSFIQNIVSVFSAFDFKVVKSDFSGKLCASGNGKQLINDTGALIALSNAVTYIVRIRPDLEHLVIHPNPARRGVGS